MKDNERRLVIRNYLYSLAHQLLILILPLATAPYLAQTLQKENLGTFDYYQSIVSYFVLFGCIGISLYGQREIAYVKEDPAMRSKVFAELVILRLITLAASGAILYFAVIARSEQPILFSIVAAELIAAAFDISWFYQGLDNFRVQMIRNIAVKILFVVLVFLLVKTKEDLLCYSIAYVSVNVGGNLLTWFGVGKYLTRVPLKTLSLRRHLGPTLLLFLPQIATSVYTQLDKTMVGWLLDDGNASVAIYSYSEKIVKLSLTLITSLNLVMLSRVAGYQADGEEKRSVEAIKKSFRFSAGLAVPIACGLAAVTPRFVPWFYGENWEHCIPVMIILCPIVLFIGLSGVFGVQYLLPARRMKLYTLSVLSGTVSNFGLNLILIPRMGAIGAAIATVVAEFLVLLVQALALRREFGIRLYLSTWRYFVAGGAMGGAVYALGEALNRRMGGTLLQVSAGVLIYAFLLFVLRDPFFLQIVKKILKRGQKEEKEE